jgi:hypothetical protein
MAKQSFADIASNIKKGKVPASKKQLGTQGPMFTQKPQFSPENTFKSGKKQGV